MNKQKNDATLSKLGDIYQYYIALKECFEMKAEDKIQIEVQGDVTFISGNKNIFQQEVKHHNANAKLTDRSTDFWNTLKNWAFYYSQSITFDRLIIFTTANIDKSSAFYDWNVKSATEKNEQLFNIGIETKAKESEFRPLYDFIFNGSISNQELLALLDKIEIQFLQPKIENISKEFAKYLPTIPDSNRDFYIDTLLGLIEGKVKTPPHIWEISYDEFQGMAQSLSPTYVNPKETPLPLTFELVEPTSSEQAQAQEKTFVHELERIEHNKIIPTAVSDYWKATKTITRYFANNIVLTTGLDAYRRSLNTRITNTKDQISLEQSPNNRTQEIQQSKVFCSKVLAWPATNWRGISDNESFFQNGVIHTMVDDGIFTWDLGDQHES